MPVSTSCRFLNLLSPSRGIVQFDRRNLEPAQLVAPVVEFEFDGQRLGARLGIALAFGLLGQEILLEPACILAPRAQTRFDLGIVRALLRNTPFLDVAVVPRLADRLVGERIVPRFGTRNRVLDVKRVAAQKFFNTDAFPRIETFSVLFPPEQAALDSVFRNLAPVLFYRLARLFAGFLAFLLPELPGHARGVVVHAARHFHVNRGVFVYRAMVVQIVDEAAQCRQRALHERITQHAELHGRNASFLFRFVGAVPQNIQLLELVLRHAPVGQKIVLEHIQKRDDLFARRISRLARLLLAVPNLQQIAANLVFMRVEVGDEVGEFREQGRIIQLIAFAQERHNALDRLQGVLGGRLRGTYAREQFCRGVVQRGIVLLEPPDQPVDIFVEHQCVDDLLLIVGDGAEVLAQAVPYRAARECFRVFVVVEVPALRLVPAIVLKPIVFLEEIRYPLELECGFAIVERPGHAGTVFGCERHFLARGGFELQVVDKRPHAKFLEERVPRECPRRLGFQGAHSDQMPLRAERTLHEERRIEVFPQRAAGWNALAVHNDGKFLFVVFDAVGVMFAHASLLGRIAVLLKQAEEILAERLRAGFLDGGGQFGDAAFHDALRLLHEFLVLVLVARVGRRFLAGTFESAALGDMIEGAAKRLEGDFHFRGAGTVAIGIGSVSRLEPAQKSLVRERVDSFRLPGVEFGQRQRAHLLADEDSQQFPFARLAAELQAPRHAIFAPRRGRGFRRFIINSNALREDHDALRGNLLQRFVQHRPAQRVGSQVDS